MLKLSSLYIRMLRYRVAVMLLMFFLLGIAYHQKAINISLNFIWAIVALFSSYVAATSINDLADKKIDKINHPFSKGRPLINGDATEKDLYKLHAIAVFIALISSLLISKVALLLISISLAINYLYSLNPLKLSYRTHFAHLILTIAYVFLPYRLGLEVVNESLLSKDILFLISLMLLFFGRIVLKDFRDRRGDAQYGKPTLLLRYGKSATCLISLIFVVSGNLTLLFALSFNIILFCILELNFATIYYVGYELWKSKNHDSEQIAIGIAAKMGNSLLLTVLGLLILDTYQAQIETRILFSITLSAIFLTNFILLLLRPKYALIGYRG